MFALMLMRVSTDCSPPPPPLTHRQAPQLVHDIVPAEHLPAQPCGLHARHHLLTLQLFGSHGHVRGPRLAVLGGGEQRCGTQLWGSICGTAVISTRAGPVLQSCTHTVIG